MPEHKGHLVDEIAAEAAEEALTMVDMIREELGYMVGSEEVAVREARAKIRKALAGDEVAYLQVLELVSQQGTIPNPMVREIGAVLNEAKGKDGDDG